jgi:ribosomal protein S18 acetylase RimI-like enzyme
VSLHLRPAVGDDVPALVALARESWLSAFAGTAPESLIAAWRTADREPEWYRRYWPAMTVAERDGALVGLVQPKDAEVNGLWVRPDAQARGVGSTLLAHAERQIAATGHATAWLTCSGYNTRALGFYAARGYGEVRRSGRLLFDGSIEEIIVLERAISSEMPSG